MILLIYLIIKCSIISKLYFQSKFTYSKKKMICLNHNLEKVQKYTLKNTHG